MGDPVRAVCMGRKRGRAGDEVRAPSHTAVDPDETPRYSRRQALGRMSAVAGAGVAAWAVPEILTAKPAAGATLSGATEPSSVTPVVATNATNDGGTPGSPLASALAFTGLDLQRDAAVGAALVAGGWVMHHWASRTPTPAAPDAPTSEPGTPSPATG
jgi:hypothetical protein